MEIPATPTLTADDKAELRQILRRSGRGRKGRAAREEHRARSRELLSAKSGQTEVKRYEVSLRRDDAGRFEMLVSEPSSELAVEVAIDDPAGRAGIRADGRGVLGGKWPQRGPFQASAKFDLGRIPDHHSHRSPIEGEFQHRFLKADGHVHIRDLGDAWEAQVRIRIGVRGALFRPAGAVLALLAGGRMRRAFEQSVRGGPDITAELERELARVRLCGADPNLQNPLGLLDSCVKVILESDPEPAA